MGLDKHICLFKMLTYVFSLPILNIDGNLHNADFDENGYQLPAIIHEDGTKKYHINGKEVERQIRPIIK